MKVTNCEHFHEMHPGIEGGCSDESRPTVTNTNVESERIIGKGSQYVSKGDKQQGTPDDNSPPEECIVNNVFIGEEACRSLVDKASSGKSPDGGPPEECIVNGKFIGENKCRALVEKTPQTQPEKTESQETATKKGFLQRVVAWFVSLFK